MARIDSILSILDRQAANELRLGTDREPQMLADGAQKRLVMPKTSTDTLRELLGELLPADREQALVRDGQVQFVHEAPGLGPFRVALTRRGPVPMGGAPMPPAGGALELGVVLLRGRGKAAPRRAARGFGGGAQRHQDPADPPDPDGPARPGARQTLEDLPGLGGAGHPSGGASRGDPGERDPLAGAGGPDRPGHRAARQRRAPDGRRGPDPARRRQAAPDDRRADHRPDPPPRPRDRGRGVRRRLRWAGRRISG